MRKRLIATLALTISLALFLASCDKKTPAQTAAAATEPTAPQRDVYAGGAKESANGISMATVWKNNEVLWSLAKGATYARVYSIAVSGADVYAGGEESTAGEENPSSTAIIWKNGAVRWRLTDGTHQAAVCSLVVEGNDVHAGGYERVGDGEIEDQKSAAVVWKNGKVIWAQTAAGGGDGSSGIVCIAVSGKDVYAGGWEEREVESEYGLILKIHPIVWKNGEVLWRLTEPGTEGRVASLAVSGRDVYACGTVVNDRDAATVWKNGKVLWNLTDGAGWAGANSLFVSGGDVYAGGFEQNKGATVWKNGKVLWRLTDGAREAKVHSLVVSGGDVYAGGWEGDTAVATVWKNDAILSRLMDPAAMTEGGQNARVQSIFVQQKQ